MDVDEKTAAEEMVEAVEERKPTWYITSVQGQQNGRLETNSQSFSVGDIISQLIGVPRGLITVRDFYFTTREGGYGMQFTCVYSITGSKNELTIDLDVNHW
jgi:hypothetical protein